MSPDLYLLGWIQKYAALRPGDGVDEPCNRNVLNGVMFMAGFVVRSSDQSTLDSYIDSISCLS